MGFCLQIQDMMAVCFVQNVPCVQSKRRNKIRHLPHDDTYAYSVPHVTNYSLADDTPFNYCGRTINYGIFWNGTIKYLGYKIVIMETAGDIQSKLTQLECFNNMICNIVNDRNTVDLCLQGYDSVFLDTTFLISD